MAYSDFRVHLAKTRARSLGTTVLLLLGTLLCGLVACDRVEEPPEVPPVVDFEPVAESPAEANVVTADPVFDAAFTFQIQAGVFGITELMMAAMNGDADAVASLINSGADVNATDAGNSTALMWSAPNGNADIARILIANGADITARDNGNGTALMRSAAAGNVEIVNLLLDNGADVNAVDTNGSTSLGNAVASKHETTALVLLDYGADANAHRENYKSYLQYAVDAGQASVVDSLIQNGADLEAQGWSAVVQAARKGNQAIVKLLIDAGVAADETNDNRGTSPLYVAAHNGDVDMVDFLLATGVSAATAGKQSPPLHVAAKSGHKAVVESLLLNGATPSVSDLYVALDNRQSEVAQILLNELDIDSIDRKSVDVLLIVADRTGQTNFVQQFFAAAAGPRTSDASVRLLYRPDADTDCNLMLWDPRQETEKVVFASKGECTAEFFVADNESTLFVLEETEFQVISLDDVSNSHRVELPMQRMKRQLEAVKERVRGWDKGEPPDWMAANVAAIGYLDSGDLGLLIHVGMPGDGTSSFLIGNSDDDWVLVDEGGCGRMDNYCSFPQLNGRQIDDWLLQRAIWHPNIQRNVYFTSNSAEFEPVRGKELQGGEVLLDIDGQPLTIAYKTVEGGHCSDDCTFTMLLEARVEDGEPMVLSSNGGNSAIAGHFALVRGDDRQSAELLDIRSGKSVLGRFSIATWVE